MNNRLVCINNLVCNANYKTDRLKQELRRDNDENHDRIAQNENGADRMTDVQASYSPVNRGPTRAHVARSCIVRYEEPVAGRMRT